MTTAIIIGGIMAALLAAKKKGVSGVGATGVGATKWEDALGWAEALEIDLTKDYYEQPYSVLSDLRYIRQKVGYRQSASSRDMGRSETYSFYLALQRKAGIH